MPRLRYSARPARSDNDLRPNLRSLRKQLGLVTQDTVLFDDTIANNIAYGKPGATAEEVEAAAKKAHAHEFIVTLTAGYETRTGDMAASKLSGGQKQRIALARAILRDPRILILDEFTSQIDGESEAKIHEALREFVVGRTTFLITHRRSTLELASRIVVMDEGRIQAMGTHAELQLSSPTYRRLYDTVESEPANADAKSRPVAAAPVLRGPALQPRHLASADAEEPDGDAVLVEGRGRLAVDDDEHEQAEARDQRAEGEEDPRPGAVNLQR